MDDAKKISLKVSPDPSLYVAATERHLPVFAHDPLTVLGSPRKAPLISESVSPTPSHCFGPRGSLLHPDGSFWICDTGHCRLLGWKQVPKDDMQEADWVIGQPNFFNEGRNANGAVNATSLNVPTGICALGDQGIAVADAWNNRVLLYWNTPAASHTPADTVLGQVDFSEGMPNHGGEVVSGNTMHWPFGVSYIDSQLFVTDSKNRRILIWDSLPEQDGQAADRVLGQDDLTRHDENGGVDTGASGYCWPHSVCLWQGNLCVADAGNNRILIYEGMPKHNNETGKYVLGQSNMQSQEHNQALYWPRAHTLNMPYALTAIGPWLLVADTANSRILGWHKSDLQSGANARLLAAQPHFNAKGDNRWKQAVADSLCWPYGLSSLTRNSQTLVAIADSGNNRVSIWKFAHEQV